MSYFIAWDLREKTDLVTLAWRRKNSSLQNP